MCPVNKIDKEWEFAPQSLPKTHTSFIDTIKKYFFFRHDPSIPYISTQLCQKRTKVPKHQLCDVNVDNLMSKDKFTRFVSISAV